MSNQKDFVKHLIECKCILPQFRKMDEPPFHKFIVFSELEEGSALVKTSFAQCPNCGAVHRINEVGLSKILNKDSMLSLPTIEDIKLTMPEKLTAILERHECDLPTWQEVDFIVKNQMWGRTVILAKEREGELVYGKYMTVLSENLQKIDNFERFDGLIEIK